MTIVSAASAYLAAGLSVLPACLARKRPALGSWKDFQQRLPTTHEIAAWFANPHDACCIICGVVSGHLELIDFDCAGESFAAWSQLVNAETPGLMDRLVVESSPSGGWHVAYRCAEPVSGNIKLAQRREDLAGRAEVIRHGKGYRPRKDREGRWHIILTMIETRGEGGLFLCAPTAGYQLVQGDFTALPVLTTAERDILLRCAWALNQILPETQDPQPVAADGLRPGDDFNRRADVAALLRHHGWSLFRDGENQHWCRPGKTSGTSATLKDRVFYVFSSNAAPFEANRAYSPFAVFALLEHGGDYSAAAAALRRTMPTPPVERPAPDPVPAVPPPIARPAVVLRTHADRERERSDPPAMLIDGVLPLGGLGAIVALPGSGKTLIATELARAVAAGDAFLGRTVHQGAVIYACPDAPASTERRMLAIPDHVAGEIYTVCDLPALPLGIDGLRSAIADINTATPVRLLVLDTWDSTRQHGGDGWAGQDALVEGLMQELRTLARDLQLAVVVVHHATRNDHGRARGSVVFDARADWIAIAEGEGGTVCLRTIKCRDGERGDLGGFRIQAVDVHGRSVPTLTTIAQTGPTLDASVTTDRATKLLTYLASHPGNHTAAHLALVLGLRGKGTVSDAVAVLRSRGYIAPDSYQPTPAGMEAVDDHFLEGWIERPDERPETLFFEASGRCGGRPSGRSPDDSGRSVKYRRPLRTLIRENPSSSARPPPIEGADRRTGRTADERTTGLATNSEAGP